MDKLIVVIFLLVTLIIGIKAGKNIKTVKDYALANYRYGFIPLILTFLATMIGGDDTTGDLAEFFDNGIIYAIPYVAFIISIILVGIYIAPKIDHRFKGMISISDMIKYFYGKNISIITAIIGCLATLGYATAQNIALGHLLSDLTGYSYKTCLYVGGGIVILYTIFGGIRSVVVTDILQFCLLITILPIICNVAVTEVGGIINLVEKIPATHLNIIERADLNEYVALFFIWILPVNYFLPALMHRFLMANNPKQVRNICFIYAAVLLALLFIMMSLSLSTLILYPHINGKEIIPTIISNLLPVGIKGLAISGMIAVIMSTIDSNLNTSGIIFTHNVLNKKKNELLHMRINTGLIGLIAILIARNDYNIISVLVFVQVMLSVGIGIPLAAALFDLRVKSRDFYFCVAGSIISYTITSIHYGALNYMTSFFTLFTGLISFIISYIQHNRIIANVFINIKNISNKEINTTKQKWKISLPKIINYTDKSMSNSQPNYVMFGIFSAVNYIVPYFMWPQNIQSHYELMLFMRIFAGLLCIGLLLKEYWKIKYKRYFSLYWFFTLLYTLIVMPTVMFLVNNKLFEWLLNISLGIFILSMLVEWRMFLILLVKGVLIGVAIAVKLLHTEIIISNNSNIFMGIYLVVFTIIVGLTFSRKREVSINERVNHLSVLGGTIAHEMRTPLTTINANLEILKEKIINKKDKEVVDRMFMTTQRAYNVINMLLHNLKNEIKIKTTVTPHAIWHHLSHFECVL